MEIFCDAASRLGSGTQPLLFAHLQIGSAHPNIAPLARRFMAFRSLLFSVLAAVPLLVAAQDDPDSAPPPPPKKEGVQITFLPPPMKGVLSLGIYSPDGKLARVLHREATEKNFTIGLNGLITQWDGKNDKGEALPAGKYSARGWMTGDLRVEGVAFHSNDWITPDGPHFTQAVRIQKAEDGSWQVILRDGDNKEQPVTVSPDARTDAPALTVENGEIHKGDQRVSVPLEDGEKVIKATAGVGGNVWAIVETPGGREVRSYSASGEFLRRLAYKAEDPAPFDVAASMSNERVLLLEKNDHEQRFRILAQPEAEGAAWKTVDQKSIFSSGTFEEAATHVGRAEPPKPAASVKVTSKPNSLLHNAKTDVQIQATAGPDGAVLTTADGLPLAQITNAKRLKWCALFREGNALTLLQSDGSVVEEFKIGRPDNIMAFDAGEYPLKR